MKHADPYQNSDGSRLPIDMAIVARLTAEIREAPLDCECKPKLDETLAHFTVLERRRTIHKHLLDARHCREQIETMIYYLNDLDELGPAEQDRSVYVDIALLFDDIARIAHEGAYSMRQLSEATGRGDATT
ncbi:MAG: hypothetical protein WBA88_27095 [Pseudaminobacter sp.]|jgi:hypothetical protein|uniref:Uncharacterized protein n=1 Tax=Aquamicrobium defluvii TaxID=69279 RepID=A0A011UPZ9_9HYPH|nr:hypothetical protein [Aquamicrobium defluvii]EXL07943.1 hypothetical protein BG36_04240 [Aquamicrobium defluvii]EZQ15014.1 hypothetical protein CF98_14170 [Halopseudomonas bauzanensis]